MIYLMAPYTHPSPSQQLTRYEVITLVLGELMQQFPYEWIFSPITQGHATVPFLPAEVANNHQFWMQQCRHALQDADRAFLLPLPGWPMSKGVHMELQWCQELDTPVVLLDCVIFFKQIYAQQPIAIRTLLYNYIQDADRLHTTGDYALEVFYSLATKRVFHHLSTVVREE